MVGVAILISGGSNPQKGSKNRRWSYRWYNQSPLCMVKIYYMFSMKTNIGVK